MQTPPNKRKYNSLVNLNKDLNTNTTLNLKQTACMSTVETMQPRRQRIASFIEQSDIEGKCDPTDQSNKSNSEDDDWTTMFRSRSAAAPKNRKEKVTQKAKNDTDLKNKLM